MNIVVLAGGLSTERDVSLNTGTMVSKALRSKGHNVIMLDVFMGYHEEEEDITDIFNHTEEASADVAQIPGEAPDIAQVKAMRKDQSACFFGPNVIKICQAADIVFMALHGENGENGKIQQPLICLVSSIQAAVIWEVPLPWIKEFQKKCLRQLVFRHRTVLQ